MANSTGSVEIIEKTEQLLKDYQTSRKARLEKNGLKNVYCKILSVLSQRDGDTQLDLVQRSGLQAPTVSITLRGMEREGLVKRVSDENDLRKSHVFITENGRSRAQEAENASKEFGKLILDGISDEEIEVFLNVLKKIEKNMK